MWGVDGAVSGGGWFGFGREMSGRAVIVGLNCVYNR